MNTDKFVPFSVSVWSCRDLTLRLLSLTAYFCAAVRGCVVGRWLLDLSEGFIWKIICADFTGRFYVRIYMVDYVCGFQWPIQCADFNGRLYVRL